MREKPQPPHGCGSALMPRFEGRNAEQRLVLTICHWNYEILKQSFESNRCFNQNTVIIVLNHHINELQFLINILKAKEFELTFLTPDQNWQADKWLP